MKSRVWGLLAQGQVSCGWAQTLCLPCTWSFFLLPTNFLRMVQVWPVVLAGLLDILCPNSYLLCTFHPSSCRLTSKEWSKSDRLSWPGCYILLQTATGSPLRWMTHSAHANLFICIRVCIFICIWSVFFISVTYMYWHLPTPLTWTTHSAHANLFIQLYLCLYSHLYLYLSLYLDGWPTATVHM